MRFLRWLDDKWSASGRSAFEVWGLMTILGVIVTLASWWIGVDSVTFRGIVQGTELSDYPPTLAKEVGFFFAPNWAASAIILVPITFLMLCLARGAIDHLFDDLLERRMLRRIDGESVNRAEIKELWRTRSSKWMGAWLSAIVIVFLITMIMDFGPVVAQWLIWPDNIHNLLRPSNDPAGEVVSLAHSVYEFDWSIAATYDGETVYGGHYANLAFSLFAYVFIGVLGPGLILGALIWLPALPSFLRNTNLRQYGLEIVPDITSGSKRCGFEVFESVYRYVVLGVLGTSLLALSMHVQNLYLRSDAFDSIYQMVIADPLQTIPASYREGGPERVFLDLLNRSDDDGGTSAGLDPEIDGLNLQVGVSVIGMLLLIVVVIVVLAVFISVTPRRGAQRLRAIGGLTSRQKRKLRRMKPWPDLFMSRPLLTAYGFVLILSLFQLRLVIGALFVLIVGLVVSTVRTALTQMLSNLADRKEDEEDDDLEGNDSDGLQETRK